MTEIVCETSNAGMSAMYKLLKCMETQAQTTLLTTSLAPITPPARM